MSDFYNDMQALASELLTEFKQGVITYVGLTPGTGTADEPGEPVETPTVLKGAVARGVEFKYVKGTGVLSTDLQITIPADTITPAPQGFFIVDGQRLKTVEIHRIPAAGTPVAYTIIVRK